MEEGKKKKSRKTKSVAHGADTMKKKSKSGKTKSNIKKTTADETELKSKSNEGENEQSSSDKEEEGGGEGGEGGQGEEKSQSSSKLGKMMGAEKKTGQRRNVHLLDSATESLRSSLREVGKKVVASSGRQPVEEEGVGRSSGLFFIIKDLVVADDAKEEKGGKVRKNRNLLLSWGR